MENLRYSEILQQNSAMKEKVIGAPYKVKVLANVTINSLKEILEYIFRINQINPVIEFGNYDNIVQDSRMSAHSDIVIVFVEMLNIVSSVSVFFEDINDGMYNDIKSRMCAEIDNVLENLKDCPSVIFNTFSSTPFVTGSSRKSKITIFTSELNKYLDDKKCPNVTLLDIDIIISQLGIRQAIDYRLFNSSKAPYTLSFFKNYVSALEPIILRNTGKLKKAIIFDCDNTLWKGIVGEDGFNGIDMSATSHDGRPFNMVQQIALFLSRRGVIVGLCSKNNEADVTDILLNHPDIVLKEEFIVIKKINWENKALNLRSISTELNIGLDSIVFVDDSSFEINYIREHLQEIVSIQVPTTIFEYPDYLLRHVYKYFNLTPNDEDSHKTALYKQQFQRENDRKKFETIDEYLASLKMVITIYKDDPSFIQRIAQLTQKTNQFNLTTKRYTESQILKFMEDGDCHVFAVSVKDEFGDNGLTAVAIITADKYNRMNISIDTFLMSCRIIGRNIEYAFIDYIMKWLKKESYQHIYSEYISTKKNSQVISFYDDLGFILLRDEENEKHYSINILDYEMKNIEYLKLEAITNGKNAK